ncbi:2-succinyl-5-enolpyruvyl-6-hydroxy-3-cyclohexene-1-carboxylic-acid synthase [Shewanella sp. NIFS-20-20]|uniref:2-succinyl-5-enolpyruvyl-6-hydroxy-3- cyclohexene-1-carboxylic-acid synthase n=1 Tax=Shewanella sp. NIFS-20-20 TaxID=2853806 RepID=UPI001C47F848|nr:2-succinyl-5-enolpyruvyl-6-hydroxy-3-cyclohexene-1-carboxylic-acid synthase [Shewanella sp. NIFS-20-20]MBV7316314.1 2-succinyl-5-enolpyruvyl-6-hydroxy-3-cyclohexene-1-carboxylic-acid synthase [Shewanella sp. NIFS-20-20]
MQIQHTAELNLLWGSMILDELARLGVKHVCMAPGSRSTPLTLAAANQDKLKQHLHFDERGLGFLALGLAKASRAPVAIITTSGTAVANLYPAIVEAWLTQVPLIVLSGDRPPELLDCGANQAIVQAGIFAGYARPINLPTPDWQIPPHALLTQIDEAVSNLQQPLHINCMYREPLYPKEVSTQVVGDYLQGVSAWHHSSQPYCQHPSWQANALPSAQQIAEFSHAKGVIVAGTLSPQQQPQQLLALAKQLGWPLLVDAQSQLRQDHDTVHHIDQLLQHPQASALLQQAEHVLVFGGRLLSKRLIQYLAEQPWHAYWQVLPTQQRLDPSHQSKLVLHCSLTSLCQQGWGPSPHNNWAAALETYQQQLEQRLLEHIDQGEFGEAQVVRHFSAHGDLNQLFIGNSLPVRLFDMYARCRDTPLPVYTNRGASGIDGLLATACGIAMASPGITGLLIGDLSQLHDLNSMALAKQVSEPLVIVILNNDGGNIFNLLPVPNEALRQQYYRLSHGLSFAGVSQMFSLPYHKVLDLNAFTHALAQAQLHPGASVIEVFVAPEQASNQIAALGQLIRHSPC